jgi:plastocyanin
MPQSYNVIFVDNKGSRQLPMKKFLGAIALMGLLTIVISLVAACGNSPTASGPNQVHMNDSNFDQPSITLKKGEDITLVNDTAAIHIIDNGTWDSNGNARSVTEPGAPPVNLEIDGYANKKIAFSTAGTFHLYCTIHPGMNLTVIVK